MGDIVLVLLEDKFEDSEAVYPYYRMQEAGFDVKLVAPEAGKEYTGKQGVKLTSDVTAGDIDVEKVAAVIIPGGYAPDRLRRYKEIVDLVRKAHDLCKVIAAICHGGWMLAEADILKGKEVTGVKAISTDLKNAGANYVFKEVVVDENIVTSRAPMDLPAFCKNIIELVEAYRSK